MSIRGKPTYSQNPFKKYGIDQVIVNIGLSENLVVEPDSGELFALRRMNKSGTKRVDRHTFVKVFYDAIDTIKDLSKPGLKLFCYILKNVELKKDYVNLIERDVSAYCGYSDRSKYYEAISELIDKKFIAKSNDKKKYFINTNLFFNGDRTA